MERLDFCSITTIIKDYCNDEKLGAQVNYVEKLFRTCVYGDEDECVSFDDTQVCRWLKGQTPGFQNDRKYNNGTGKSPVPLH